MRNSLRFGSTAFSFGRIAPWLSLALIWLVFDLPMALAPDRLDLAFVRPTGEILGLFTALGLSYRVRHGRPIRWVILVVAVVLSVLRVDRAVFFLLTRTEPLLYDQLFMLRHFVVLIFDLFSVGLLLSLLGVALGVTLVSWGMGALFRKAAPLREPSRTREAARVILGAWALVLLLTAMSPAPPSVPFVRWMTPALLANVAESRHIYRATRARIEESPYRSFDTVRLARKPDVLLLFVESYGKLMAERPSMRGPWALALTAMNDRLSHAGWHAVSGYGTAPVSGGRSWLAVGSILMGTTIRYEAEFKQLMDSVDRLPTLPRFFSEQGYETVLLAPSDRSRLGMRAENHYSYDRYVRFSDLDYRGPAMGWGVVPDQYALGFTQEHVLKDIQRPLFLHFHMVSSHAPWEHIPEYVEDFDSWNQSGARRTESHLTNEVGRRLTRYSRQEAHDGYMGALTEKLRDGFVTSVLYDFRVVEEFLAERPKDALVILMGDHQPPVVAPETEGFDVPIHVLARDPKLLEEFVTRGFSPGLVLPRDGTAVVEHAGLFSLIVRALGRSCGVPGQPLPEYFPHGASGVRGEE
jgi:hypothetical protein